MNVSVPAASFSSRLRRLASTVGRTNSPPTNNNSFNNNSSNNAGRPLATFQTPPTPTSPVGIGLASAMVADMSLSPKIIHTMSPGLSGTITPRTTPSSSSGSPGQLVPTAPPQLPNLPAFEPIAEEAEPLDEVPPGPRSAPLPVFRQASPHGHSHSHSHNHGHGIGILLAEPDSMTEGSSASSGTNASADMTLAMTISSSMMAPFERSNIKNTDLNREGEKNRNRGRDDGDGDCDGDRDTDRDTLGPLPSVTAPAHYSTKVPPNMRVALPSTPMAGMGVEDLVSPLSAGAMTPGSGGGGGAAGRFAGGVHQRSPSWQQQQQQQLYMQQQYRQGGHGQGGGSASVVSSPDTPGWGQGGRGGV